MEKINENDELPKTFKNIHINKIYKKSYSSRKLRAYKSLHNANKDTFCLENVKDSMNSNNLNKHKKRKIMKKEIMPPKKLFFKKGKTVNDDFQKSKNKENSINKRYNNIFCCL